MKWNNRIRNNIDEIYSVDKARELYRLEQFGSRKLSLMKQENIRMAIKEKYDIDDILGIVISKCGYCFKQGYNCESCSLYKKYNEYCTKLISYEKMLYAKTIKTFAKWHKIWCQELGIWNKNWE